MLRKINILCQGYKATTMCACMMLNWTGMYLHILTSQETLNCLVIGNDSLMYILVIVVLIQVRGQSLQLSIHSWSSQHTVYVRHYERSLILDWRRLWQWCIVHLLMNVGVVISLNGAIFLKLISNHFLILEVSMF